MNGYTVQTIPRSEAIPWIKLKHYARRVPAISHSFGLFKDELTPENTLRPIQLILQGVCTLGMPPSGHLCRGICGEEYKDLVFELNRVCLNKNKMNECSFLISQAIKLIDGPKILVSYSDTAVGHVGYIYQATNWIYTGLNNDVGRKNPRRYRKSSLKIHDRHIKADDKDSYLISIPLKHRYIYFIGSKKEKKEMLKALNYPILPYPKGESKRYDTSIEFPKQVQLF